MPLKVYDQPQSQKLELKCLIGPEKLLEVWFSASSDTLPVSTAAVGLKNVPTSAWKEMLELVNCQVLSIVESEQVDAYLLSESSMFVFPHKLILKTCGTTTLLCGLPKILELAAEVAGFPHSVAGAASGMNVAATPYRVFYSRKNFLFPDRQVGPHRSWRDEVKSLDRLFYGGSAYLIGKMNGEHWYLYLTEPYTMLTPPATPTRPETETRFIDLPEAKVYGRQQAETSTKDEDETLEILMTDLEVNNAKQFYMENAATLAEGQYFQRVHKARSLSFGLNPIQESITEEKPLSDSGYDFVADDLANTIDVSNDEALFSSESSIPDKTHISSLPDEPTTEGHSLGTVVSEACGLNAIYAKSSYPDARIDAYLFTPCGFSANGVIPAPNTSDRSGATAPSTHYFTVHVTPEPHCSYASFETNVPSRQSGRETAEVVEQVVGIFKPGRFSVTLFEAKGVDSEGKERSAAKKGGRMDFMTGYKKKDSIVHELEGYELVFRYFEREGWEGGSPRLGEVGF